MRSITAITPVNRLFAALGLALGFFLLGAVVNASVAQAFTIPVSSGGGSDGGSSEFSNGGVRRGDPPPGNNVPADRRGGDPASGGDGQEIPAYTPGPNNTMSRIVTTTRTYWRGHPQCSAPAGRTVVGYTEIERRRFTMRLPEEDDLNQPSMPPQEQVISPNTIRCHYSSAYVDSRVRCVTTTSLNVNMVVPQNRNIYSRTYPTAFSGNPTLANCLNSAQSYSVDVDISAFGRYQSVGQSRAVSCIHRSYTTADPRTGIIPGDILTDCSGEYPINAMTARAQIDCSGAYSDWRGNPSWTVTECSNQNSDDPLFQCVVGDTVRVNGTPRRTVQLLRDGEDSNMVWDSPRITGGAVRSFNITGTTMARSGQPWLAGNGVTNNVFELSRNRDGGTILRNSEGTGRLSGSVTNWFGRWYQATDSNNGTKLQPTYDFNTSIEIATWRIVEISPWTGGWTMERSSAVIDSSGQCDGPALDVQTLRVLNDQAS